MPKPAISVDVNANPIPWIKLIERGRYDIEFVNSNETKDITVTFGGALKAPANVLENFTVGKNGDKWGFEITATAATGSYSYSTSGGGGGGNGGIEIGR